MSRKDLPAAAVTRRPGIQTYVTPEMLDAWNPRIAAAASDEGNTISILDVIGFDWFGDGVTAKSVAARLRAFGPAADVTVNINSPGGDLFEGLAIYNTLREHAGKVTVKVLGLAASAASVIAMAGDEIRVARAGFLMIHNGWVLAIGDRNDLREIADWLTPFDATIADIYAARTGLAHAEVAAMMDVETWIGGQQAVDGGWADGLLPSDEVDAKGGADGPKTMAALRRLEMYLSRGGASRAERRELVKGLGGMPSAAPTGMPGAADDAGVASALLANLKRF